MELTDIIIVTENIKGNEKNYLMETADYISFIEESCDLTRIELALNMCRLGRTLSDNEDWSEIYLAANKTISARYCYDEMQMEAFLMGDFNSEKDWTFDVEKSGRECLECIDKLGININGHINPSAMHYEQLESHFEQGQILHNFNNNDYRVLECLTDDNLLLMDLNTGNYVVGIGVKSYHRSPKGFDGAKGMDGIEWAHGVYFSNVPSEIDFKAVREKYGAPVNEETLRRPDGRFDVEIREILSRIEPIEAETVGEAIDKAMELYESEQIVLDYKDMKDVDFTPYADKNEKRDDGGKTL